MKFDSFIKRHIKHLFQLFYKKSFLIIHRFVSNFANFVSRHDVNDEISKCFAQRTRYAYSWNVPTYEYFRAPTMCTQQPKIIQLNNLSKKKKKKTNRNELEENRREQRGSCFKLWTNSSMDRLTLVVLQT